jgi:hypothetical protein
MNYLNQSCRGKIMAKTRLNQSVIEVWSEAAEVAEKLGAFSALSSVVNKDVVNRIKADVEARKEAA